MTLYTFTEIKSSRLFFTLVCLLIVLLLKALKPQTPNCTISFFVSKFPHAKSLLKIIGQEVPFFF